MNKLAVNFVGLLTGISGIKISRINSNLDTRLTDLELSSRVSSKELMMEFLTNKQQITVEITSTPVEERDLIEDAVNYWINSDKHLMIIGGTGDGKSTTIKYFISRLNDWDITTFDVDYSKGDYPDNVKVKYDYSSISEAMKYEIEELETRIEMRRDEGKGYSPTPHLTIAEELPALALEIGEDVSRWIRVKSSRGRKVLLKLACLAQNDTAENLALKGNVALRDNNFILLYLGRKAIEKAKQDKDKELIQWLESAPYGRGILDGKPCSIQINNLQPNSSITTKDLEDNNSNDSLNGAESIDRSTIKPEEAPDNTPQIDNILYDMEDILYKSDEDKIPIAIALKNAGYSKTSIIKRLWDVQGGKRFTDLSTKIDEAMQDKN